MPLFDELERTDKGSKTYGEPTYAYYNRSARPGIAAMREMLERWFAIFPKLGQAHLKGHFCSPIENQHQAAFFELYMHELLVRLGFSVELHPPAEFATTHPDYLVAKDGKPMFYLEATLAGVPSTDEQAAGSRTAVVYDAINAMDSPNFFIRVQVKGAPATPPHSNQMRADLSKWLSSLDPDVVHRLYEDGEETPTLNWTHNGWSVVFSPIPKGPKFRGKPGVRPIGVHMSEPRWLNTQGDIKDAIEKKSGRYGNLRLAYVIALNVLSLHCDRTDILNAGCPTRAGFARVGFLIRWIFKPAMAKSGDYGDQEKRLVSRGVLIPPAKKRPSTSLPEPPGNVSDEVMKQVWREEREGR